MIMQAALPYHFRLRTLTRIVPGDSGKIRRNLLHRGTDVLSLTFKPRGGGGGHCRSAERRKTRRARACLIEHNLRLVVYIAQKFDNTELGVEDLISIGTIRPDQSY